MGFRDRYPTSLDTICAINDLTQLEPKKMHCPITSLPMPCRVVLCGRSRLQMMANCLGNTGPSLSEFAVCLSERNWTAFITK